MSEEQLRQLISTHSSELKVKGSRFIADLVPVKTSSDAKAALDTIRKREFNANHHCFAWRIVSGGDISERSSDDGEPAGTAGKPILQILASAGLINTLAVVTRYFGGTKLGKGGLIRAYGGVIQEALPGLRTKLYRLRVKLACRCPFDLSNHVYRLVEGYEGEIVSQDYGEEVDFLLLLPEASADRFSWELFEVTGGKLKCVAVED